MIYVKKITILFFVISITLSTQKNIFAEKTEDLKTKQQQLILELLKEQKKPSLVQKTLSVPQKMLKHLALISTSLVLGIGTTAIVNGESFNNIINDLLELSKTTNNHQRDQILEKIFRKNSGKAIQIGAELIVFPIAYYISLLLLFDYIFNPKDNSSKKIKELTSALKKIDHQILNLA